MKLCLKYPSNQIELMAAPLGGKMSALRRYLRDGYGLDYLIPQIFQPGIEPRFAQAYNLNTFIFSL